MKNSKMRPSKGSKTGDVWDAADLITTQEGRMALRQEVIDYCTSHGGNSNTANTQYGEWKRGTFPNAVRSHTKRSIVEPKSERAVLNETEKPFDSHWSSLLKNGFTYFADWVSDEAQTIFIDREPPDESGLYVFVLNDKVVYIGVTSRTLRDRMADYRRGHSSQRTSSRIKKLIYTTLNDGNIVRVLYAVPGHTEWNGLSVEIAPGLESSLIKIFQPRWNIKGR